MSKSFFSLISTFSILFLAGALLTGCSKKPANAMSIFDSASPDIKAIWDSSIAADKANDYVTAIQGYRSLMKQKTKLTDKQIDVLDSVAVALNQRFNDAVNSGDPAAKQAADQLARMISQP